MPVSVLQENHTNHSDQVELQVHICDLNFTLRKTISKKPINSFITLRIYRNSFPPRFIQKSFMRSFISLILLYHGLDIFRQSKHGWVKRSDLLADGFTLTKFKTTTRVNTGHKHRTYSVLCQIPMMEPFAKIIISLKPLTIFAKRSVNKCLIDRFWIRIWNLYLLDHSARK